LLKRKVLYVEDNLLNLQLVEQILKRRSDIELLSATGGRDGLELAKLKSPDLILLDLHLPQMNGEEVLHHLKEIPATRNIPVIIVSADATSKQMERLIEKGARAYLTKPFAIHDFVRLLDENLVTV
jgi:CheY-like chemotaxis protein